jgi:hypothetical protein
MATVDKNFRVKNGLIVEGTTAKVDDKDILLDGDSTDLLEEGETNLFYTDGRVKDVLTGSTQENISITVEDGVLTIAAENGVSDSTTDDLDEGENNLYYTDERARGAISDGDGISYDDQTGEISADLGNGLGIDAEDKIEVVTGNGLEIGEDGEVQIDTAITVDVDSEQTISNKILGSDLDADNNKITNLDDPTEAGDAANKGYVDAFAEGLHIHASVAVATTQDIGNLASPPATIDGVTLVEGMRVLVKDQEGSAFNGIYVFEDGALVRAEDYDTANEIQAGDFVFVEGGETYGSTGWAQLNSVTTLGTDAIVWTQFLGAGTFIGGKGIAIDGQEVEIDFTEFDTDDIDEGASNLYFTDQRVIDLLTGSSQTNIAITEYDGQLIFVAENGVGDSTTDDLTEGTTNLYFTDQRAQDAVTENLTTDDLDEGETNLYFTDQRAVDALEAVTPNFTEVEINSLSKQVAATVTATTAETPTVVYEFDKTEYRSGKFIVKAASGSHTQISEVLITLDSSDNVAITEYAIVSTNGILVDVTAAEATGDVQIIVEAVNANTTVTVFGTLIV